MEELIFQSLFKYYGLDWFALACGLTGTTLLTRKMRSGFLLCCLSSLSGVIVALISLQFGYVIYNITLITIMVKGYRDWGDVPQKARIKRR